MSRHESVPQVNEVSRISKGTGVKGSLISHTDIRIDGILEGDLFTAGKLVLGEGAQIKGNVICTSADVWGKIEGDCTIGETVTFKKSSSFNGKLKTVRICIEMGALFEGSCEIIKKEEFDKIAIRYNGKK